MEISIFESDYQNFFQLFYKKLVKTSKKVLKNGNISPFWLLSHHTVKNTIPVFIGVCIRFDLGSRRKTKW